MIGKSVSGLQCFVPRPVNDEFSDATPQRRLQSPGSQAGMEIVMYHTAVSSLIPTVMHSTGKYRIMDEVHLRKKKKKKANIV